MFKASLLDNNIMTMRMIMTTAAFAFYKAINERAAQILSVD